MDDDLVIAVADLKEQTALSIVKDRLRLGESAIGVLEDAARGMEIVGKRFADADYFIPDLVYSGEIMRVITEMVKPSVEQDAGGRAPLGTFLIGTVAGDIHDIGKDIVSFMLDVSGFRVVDLGVDVPIHRFVEEIQAVEPDVVGLSGLLTVAFDSMKKTIDAIKEANLRDNLKIVIGGSQVDEHVKSFVGADAYCQDAMCGVALAKQWVGEK